MRCSASPSRTRPTTTSGSSARGRFHQFIRFVSYLVCGGASFTDARPPESNPGNLTLDAAPAPSAPQPLLQRQEIDTHPGRDAECVVIGVRRRANVVFGRVAGPRITEFHKNQSWNVV
jgi:hypothetical protein